MTEEEDWYHIHNIQHEKEGWVITSDRLGRRSNGKLSGMRIVRAEQTRDGQVVNKAVLIYPTKYSDPDLILTKV